MCTLWEIQMRRFSIRATLLMAALVTGLFSGPAAAQTYPARTISMLVNSGGGALEATTRTILDTVRANTGATLILENRLGGGGALGLQATKRAKPDGYTYAITFASALNLGPLINPEVDIDPIKDFAPVSNMFSIGSVVVVKDDAPYKDLRDLVAAAKAKPGVPSFGVFGAGNKVWLAQIEEMTGAKFLQVPMKTSEESLTLVLGNHLQATVATAGTAVAQRGRIKAISFGGAKPSPLLPGVPSARDMFGMEMTSWYGVLAPAGTPSPVVEWMSRELVRAVKDPKVVKLIEDSGFTMVASSPEEFAKALRSEVDTNAAILKKYPDIR